MPRSKKPVYAFIDDLFEFGHSDDMAVFVGKCIGEPDREVRVVVDLVQAMRLRDQLEKFITSAIGTE